MYPVEELSEYDDDGTMPDNVAELAGHVVGHKIVSAGPEKIKLSNYWGESEENAFVITLDDGTRVALRDNGDCCAFTELEKFLLHPDKVEHIITGVGTTDEYQTWHIYADAGDVLELTVGWSCGNPFYYTYGFSIDVIPLDRDVFRGRADDE